MRLRIISLRLACSREGSSFSHNTFQSGSTSGSTTPGGLPASRSCRACFPLSSALHSGRIPCQKHLHGFLAHTLPISVRSDGTGVVPCAIVLIRQVLDSLHRDLNTPSFILFPSPPTFLWREIRVSSVDVYQYLFGNRGDRKLDRVFCCIFYVLNRYTLKIKSFLAALENAAL